MTARPGVALLVTLLLIGAFAVAGMGVMAMGARETELAAASERIVRARTAAEAAAAATFAGWSTRRVLHLAEGGDSVLTPVTLNGAVGAVRVRRLGPDLFLIEATAADTASRPPTTARAGLLARTFDPGALAAAFPAPLVAQERIRIHAGSVSAPSPCQPPDATGPAVHAPAASISAAAVVVGTPPALVAPAPAVAEPDPFAVTRFPGLATASVPGGTVTPRPRTRQGACLPGPHNWGATAPVASCHHLLPFIHAADDLIVHGGEGRALLLVEGDLHLEGTRFHGLVIVTGRLTIGDGTTLHGAARAASIEMAGGSVSYDRCQVDAALTAGGLDRAFRPGQRWWIPLF